MKKHLFTGQDYKLFMFVGAIAVAAIVFFIFISPRSYFTFFPFLLFLFSAYSFISQRVLDKAMSGHPSLFLHRFLLFSTLKIFLMLLLMVTYVFLIKVQAVPFLISLSILYLAFLSFDIFLLLQKSEAHTKKKN